MVNNPPAHAGGAEDMSSITGSGRSLEEGNGNPLQYFCLGNLMDRGAWSATVPWGCKESDTTGATECMHTHTHTHTNTHTHTVIKYKYVIFAPCP